MVERTVPSMDEGVPPVTRPMTLPTPAGPLKVALSPGLKDPLARPQLEQVEHQGADEGLRDGLVETDRERRVLIGGDRQLVRHEQVAGHAQQREAKRRVERVLAELL